MERRAAAYSSLTSSLCHLASEVSPLSVRSRELSLYLTHPQTEGDRTLFPLEVCQQAKPGSPHRPQPAAQLRRGRSALHLGETKAKMILGAGITPRKAAPDSQSRVQAWPLRSPLPPGHAPSKPARAGAHPAVTSDIFLTLLREETPASHCVH